MPFTIRPYAASEEAAAIQLWRDCGLVRPWNDPAKEIARKLAVQKELFLVGMFDGNLVATVMAGYEGHRGWITYLAVAPSVRRRGFGEHMLAHAEARLLALGCPKTNLQVRASNSEVLAFYRKLGYQVDDVVSKGKRLIVDAGPTHP